MAIGWFFETSDVTMRKISTMTAPDSLRWAVAAENLAPASLDLRRAMVKTFAEGLIPAEADAVCGAEYEQVSHRLRYDTMQRSSVTGDATAARAVELEIDGPPVAVGRLRRDGAGSPASRDAARGRLPGDRGVGHRIDRLGTGRVTAALTAPSCQVAGPVAIPASVRAPKS
jgi:hypothetical protein